MRLGIVGLGRSGKSTLFDLLTETYGDERHASPPGRLRQKMVTLRDERLERLWNDYGAKKCTHVAVEVLDFPPAHQEQDRAGMADLLAPAREASSLIAAVRGFPVDELGPPDPARDWREVQAELVLSDLGIVEGRIARLEVAVTKPTKTREDDRKELVIMERIREHLDRGADLRSLDLTPEEARRIRGFQFLCLKPVVPVLSVDDPAAGGDMGSRLAEETGLEWEVVPARSEMEILELDAEDRAPFMEEFGITEFHRASLMWRAYRESGSVSFFTVSEKEVRAWTVPDRTPAVEAAGAVHTDMARGFIRAEVVSYEDYVAWGGMKGCREKGCLRLEGKEYPVRDGEIIQFRFSV